MHRRQLLSLPLLGRLDRACSPPAAAARRPRRERAGRRHRLPAGRGRPAGLEHPWALAFLPDGRMLVTERDGRLRLVEGGRLVERPGRRACPTVVASGQGGLLDIALHPRFAENRHPLPQLRRRHARRVPPPMSCAPASMATGWSTAEVILVGGAGRTGRHFGSRMAFDRDGPALRQPGRARRDGARPGPVRPGRQDRADHRRRCACRRTTRSSATPARGRRSTATACATRKAWRSTPGPAWSGSRSTGRAAATRSTSCTPAPTTAGR